MWEELKANAESMGGKVVSYEDVLMEMRLIESEARKDHSLKPKRANFSKESREELNMLKSPLIWYIIMNKG